MNTLLNIILITLGIAALAAYLRRDKSQDQAKQDAFIDSITVGLRDQTRKSQ